MDWLNLKELIGCILVEQALGTQYAAMFRIEYYLNPTLRKNLLRAKQQTDPEGFANIDEGTLAAKWAKMTSLVATIGAVIFLYVAGDFLFNIW